MQGFEPSIDLDFRNSFFQTGVQLKNFLVEVGGPLAVKRFGVDELEVEAFPSVGASAVEPPVSEEPWCSGPFGRGR